MNERPAALVTGGAVRLGRAIAMDLARRGHDIALHYNNSEAAATATAREIREFGVNCELFRRDLATVKGLRELVADARARFPKLTVLINSASTYEAGTIGETTEAQLERMWSVNFRAPFFLMQSFRDLAGAGAIVNIVDNKIAFNQYHYAAYLSSKKALAELTRMAALEFAPAVRVNAVAPGVVLPASERGEEYLAWRRRAIPVSDTGHPNHVCEAIHYLLTNRFVTGQTLFVDGGEATQFVGRNASTFHATNGE